MEDAAFKALVVLNKRSRSAEVRSLEDSVECERVLKSAISEWAERGLSPSSLAELALDVGAVDRFQVEFFETLLRRPSALYYFAEAFFSCTNPPI